MVEITRSSREHGGPSAGHMCMIEKFTKMNPLAFSRGTDPAVVENWMQEIEKDFAELVDRATVGEASERMEIEEWEQKKRSCLQAFSRDLVEANGVEEIMVEDRGRRLGAMRFRECTYPVCQICGKRHLGECRVGRGICYHYGRPGHLVQDCPTSSGIASAPRPH
ncbi:uncharacterized protein LOC131158679 [Malania oleifera]|uniref:uncharacterized protein LOC131158679 n=1 Tax=Malania oleifera TaxID=397392 RepID=UPI0025AEBD79|nr:uncharacterized protein LOC131158679 [Malania oleifera]